LLAWTSLIGEFAAHASGNARIDYGGAGFLGSHLCDRLLADGANVCVDNFFTGAIRNIDS
jgi:hypothetical protein